MEKTIESNVALQKPILQLIGLDKRFPGVHAVNNVHLSLYENEILGICGENGAGKSTLLKMISGVYRADKGEMAYLGQKVEFKNPQASIKAGISVIYQELSNLDNLTVAENVYLGRLPLKNGIVDWKSLNNSTRLLMQKYDLDIDPKRMMRSLAMAEKQLVEIMKAVSTDSRIIIMDEPTSSLGIDNVAKLMDIIHKVRSGGVAFIFVSHRLEELTKICDRIVVLRDGSSVAEFPKSDFDLNQLVEKMVGRNMKEFYTKQQIAEGQTILKLNAVTSQKLRNVSLEVKEGSIVGLYGMVGAGQDEILESIFGLQNRWSGSMELFGESFQPQTPSDAIERGVCYITDDRRGTGLSMPHTVRDNVVMASYGEFSKYGVINWRLIQEKVRGWIERLNIKTPSPYTKVNTLSGGNQQKVILAKWLERNPRLILFNEPTRGIDVATKHELFQTVQDLCKKGIGVLMISSDMLEMLSMADYIYTVHNGAITACFEQSQATQQALLRAAINITEEKADGCDG